MQPANYFFIAHSRLTFVSNLRLSQKFCNIFRIQKHSPGYFYQGCEDVELA